jgi:hypothetical protein
MHPNKPSHPFIDQRAHQTLMLMNLHILSDRRTPTSLVHLCVMHFIESDDVNIHGCAYEIIQPLQLAYVAKGRRVHSLGTSPSHPILSQTQPSLCHPSQGKLGTCPLGFARHHHAPKVLLPAPIIQVLSQAITCSLCSLPKSSMTPPKVGVSEGFTSSHT